MFTKTFLPITLFLSAAAGAAATQSDPLITVEASGHHIYATHEGRTVYTFDKDSANTSTCYDACAKKWPAVVVAEDESYSAPYGTIERTDGSYQLTYDQKPLYLYYQDDDQGDTYGDGLGGVWHVVPAEY